MSATRGWSAVVSANCSGYSSERGRRRREVASPTKAICKLRVATADFFRGTFSQKGAPDRSSGQARCNTI